MRFLKAIRVEQWLKNLTIFFPVILANKYEMTILGSLILVFFGFSLVVSSTYIVNDIIDLDSDRNHPLKKFRPIASGYLDISTWKIISLILCITGKSILFFTNNITVIFSSIYIFTTIFYSKKLKFTKYLDIFSISILFLLRILIGSIPFKIPISYYLFIFIFFMSGSIISSKKYSILSNKHIANSKIKIFLQDNYSLTQLNFFTYSGLVISNITYIIWVIVEKSFQIKSINFIFLVLSIFFLSIFQFIFFKQTKNSKSEDILFLLKNNFLFLISISFFVTSSLLGLLW